MEIARREQRYIYKERMYVCVYVHVYVHINKGHSICHTPNPEPRTPKARKPDPEGSGPIVYSIVCASVTIALVVGLPLLTIKV